MRARIRKRGRFCSYLLGVLKNYLADRRDHEAAAMLGGDTEFVPLSFDGIEESHMHAPANLSPESLYERGWALALIARVLKLMRDEQQSAGKVVGISEGAARAGVTANC